MKYYKVRLIDSNGYCYATFNKCDERELENKIFLAKLSGDKVEYTEK
jgi:hypothetical protein